MDPTLIRTNILNNNKNRFNVTLTFKEREGGGGGRKHRFTIKF